MTIWPSNLPQRLPLAGYQESPPDTTLRTQMDAGAAKMRRRFTANVRPINATLILTDAELEILDDFYVDDLEGGTLPFEWIHPRHADESPAMTVLFRFIKTPIYTVISRDIWQAAVELEILP